MGFLALTMNEYLLKVDDCILVFTGEKQIKDYLHTRFNYPEDYLLELSLLDEDKSNCLIKNGAVIKFTELESIL